PLQTGPRPDLAPRVPREQFLKFRCEYRCSLEGRVDMRVAQHLASHPHSLGEPIPFVHVSTPIWRRKPATPQSRRQPPRCWPDALPEVSDARRAESEPPTVPPRLEE